MFTVYGHMTCPTTYRLFKKLYQENLLSKMILIDVGIDPVKSFNKKIVSVPAIFLNDTLIYSGVFSISEATKTISDGKIPLIDDFDYRSASEKLMYGFLDSALTALYILIYNDFDELFRLKEFVEAVSRHVFYKARSDDSYNNLKKQFLEYIQDVKEYFETMLIQTIANLLIREFIQSNINDLSNERSFILYDYGRKIFTNKEFIKQYLLARNAFGRIGLLMGYPSIDPRFNERLESLHIYVSENWERLYDKIYKDQLSILRDQEYVERYLEKAREKKQL